MGISCSSSFKNASQTAPHPSTCKGRVADVHREGARTVRAALCPCGWLLCFALALLFGIRAALAQSGDVLCAEVKIVMEQRLSLERQAFEAQMHLSNGLAGQQLEDVQIALQFFDADRNAVAVTFDPNAGNAHFFIEQSAATAWTAWQGRCQARRVVRSDGYVLPAANARFSRKRSDRQGRDYWLHLFDADSRGDCTLETAGIAAQASLRGEVFEDRSANGLRKAGEPGLAVQAVKLAGTRTADGQTRSRQCAHRRPGAISFRRTGTGYHALSVGPAQGLLNDQGHRNGQLPVCQSG